MPAKDKAIVPLTESELVSLNEVRAVFARASNVLLARCVRVGITTQAQAEEMKDLIQTHGSGLQYIVRWLEDGISLNKLPTYLELRASYSRSTVNVLANLDEQTGFQAAGLEEALAPFEELFESEKFRFPLHRLAHFIREELAGDFQLASAMANDKPRLFIKLVKGEIDLLSFYHSTEGGSEVDEAFEAQEE